MDEHLRSRIAVLASDRVSGATAIVTAAIDALRAAAAAGGTTLDDAREALVLAQPSMAGIRTAIAASRLGVQALDVLATRLARSAGSIARQAAPLLTDNYGGGAPRIVTCSRSAAVEETLRAVASRNTDLVVCCSESRPGREGLALANVLADAGIKVRLYSDAGIAAAVPAATAFVTGADAISTDSFINKVGTSALCALAAACGVPVYVLAGHEKVLPADVFATLRLAAGPEDELETGSSMAEVLNPYFERVSIREVAQIVTDRGAFHPSQAHPTWPWL